MLTIMSHLFSFKKMSHILLDIDAPSDHQPFLYDLVANVVLDSVAGTARDKEHTVWKVHLRAGGGGGEGDGGIDGAEWAGEG